MQAKAQLDEAQRQLDHSVIRAPFNGIVTTRSVDVGALVLVGTPGATPLAGD